MVKTAVTVWYKALKVIVSDAVKLSIFYLVEHVYEVAQVIRSDKMLQTACRTHLYAELITAKNVSNILSKIVENVKVDSFYLEKVNA